MFARLSLFMVGGLLLCMSAVQAQTSAEPPITPALPMPPLTVPIVPTPLDAQTEAALDASKRRAFSLPLKSVPPSLMAYWLDSENQPKPSRALMLAPKPTVLKDFVFPEGVERIVAIDSQNKLLVFGTESAVAALQTIIAPLDRPEIVSVPSVTFEASLYWIDSLAPGAEQWQRAALTPRTTLPTELDALAVLHAQDRASLQLLPVNKAVVEDLIGFPFVSLDKSLGGGFGQIFYLSPAAGSHSEDRVSNRLAQIDPPYLITPNTYEVMVSPYQIKGDSARLLFGGLQNPNTKLLVHSGETFLLSGNTKAKTLKSPSPRFDAFVLAVKVHVTSPAAILPIP